jgi:MFS transporter, PAT family, beta-lactamase induction signal transducer AmpG
MKLLNLKKVKHRNPWLFVPTISLVQAIPIVIVMNVVPLIYKSMGISNKIIGVTSMLMVPFALKFIFAPIVDNYSTKRKWFLFSQLFSIACFLVLCLIMNMSVSFLLFSLILFVILAICGGFCELPIDGFYLDALTKPEQAFFVGVKSAFIRIGVIFTAGFLVMITGKYGEMRGDVLAGWGLFFGILAVFLLVAWVWHNFTLPYPRVEHGSCSEQTGFQSYVEPFRAFFTQPQALAIIFFSFIYRAGEGLLSRMGPPFLLDPLDAGGMATPVSTFGLYSTFTMVTMIVGGILGGFLLAKCSIRKTMIMLSLCMSLPNLIYVFLARFQPMQETVLNLSFIPKLFGVNSQWVWALNLYVQIGIAIETFGYGLGYSAFIYYLCYISDRSRYKASFYAISTGIQTLGWAAVGTVSGYLQEHIGYESVFIHSVIWSLPGIFCVVYLSKSMILKKGDIKQNHNAYLVSKE